MKQYSDDIMEVHKEFMNSGEEALKAAQALLADTSQKVDPVKVAALDKYGFRSSTDIRTVEEDKKERDHQTKLIEAIAHFRIKFPSHKFMPEGSAKKICEKYSLVLGSVDRYKGFVPEKNLNEINAFFTAYPHMQLTYFRTPTASDGLMRYIWGGDKIEISHEEYYKLLQKQTEREALEPMALKAAVQTFKKGLPKEVPFTLGYDPVNQDDIFGYLVSKKRRSNPFYWTEFSDAEKPQENVTLSIGGPKLFICAPLDKMDTHGYAVVDGYKLVPDPIVSIAVKHENGINGYIIITAWGDEASDELVINERLN